MSIFQNRGWNRNVNLSKLSLKSISAFEEPVWNGLFVKRGCRKNSYDYATRTVCIWFPKEEIAMGGSQIMSKVFAKPDFVISEKSQKVSGWNGHVLKFVEKKSSNGKESLELWFSFVTISLTKMEIQKRSPKTVCTIRINSIRQIQSEEQGR